VPRGRIAAGAELGDPSARLGIRAADFGHTADHAAETREAARIECRIMTLESRQRINFVQTRVVLITTDCSLPIRAMRTSGAQASPGDGFSRRAAHGWIKSNNNIGGTRGCRIEAGSRECRVAIASTALHKEGPAQQSIIQYARRDGGAPWEGSARLTDA
jgi:hypothetical protein